MDTPYQAPDGSDDYKTQWAGMRLDKRLDSHSELIALLGVPQAFQEQLLAHLTPLIHRIS